MRQDNVNSIPAITVNPSDNDFPGTDRTDLNNTDNNLPLDNNNANNHNEEGMDGYPHSLSQRSSVASVRTDRMDESIGRYNGSIIDGNNNMDDDNALDNVSGNEHGDEYENDGAEEQEYNEDGENEGEGAEAFQPLTVSKLHEFIDKALMEHSVLLAENDKLQKIYSNYLQNNPSEMHVDENKSEADLRSLYFDALKQIESLREEKEKNSSEFYQRSVEAQQQLENARGVLESAYSTLREYETRTIRNARMESEGGKPIDARVVAALMERDRRQNEEIQQRRLENAKLQSVLKKYDKMNNKRMHDESTSQHHQIDFEQLKIENQTFNEQIEERTEVCSELL